jgi:hypothetical protein
MRRRRHATDHLPQTSRAGCMCGGPYATRWLDAEMEIDIGLDNHPGSTLLPGCLSIQLDGQSAPSSQVPFRYVFPGRRRSSAAVAPTDARMGAREGATPRLGGPIRQSRATGRLRFGGRSLPRPTRPASNRACTIHELVRRGIRDFCKQEGHPHAAHRTATHARSRSRTTSINGLWKLPELWKPTGTVLLGSHKFFASVAILRRLAQASTGHHQRLAGLNDSEDTHPLAESGATMRQSERTQTHSGVRDPLSGRRSPSASASLIQTDTNLSGDFW